MHKIYRVFQKKYYFSFKSSAILTVYVETTQNFMPNV